MTRPAPLGPTALLLALTLALSLAGPAPAAWAEPPKAGDTLPPLAFAAPDNPAHRAYLGLGPAPTFGLRDVSAELVLIEIIGVYCPICHEQAPTLRKFYSRLSRDPQLSKRVKLLALAPGATPQELAFARTEQKIDFPLLQDQDMAILKLLGDPKTPFLLVARPDGKVLLSHLGKIEDEAQLAARLRSFLP